MSRISRMLNGAQKTVYHVISRTALDGFPFGDIEKEELVKIIRQFGSIYFADIIGFCVMGNHFHLLVRMCPGNNFTDEEIKERFANFYKEKKGFGEENIEYCRRKWPNLSEFIREIKQDFSRFYNRLHNRKGTLWGERFKSVIVEDGQALLNCLAYIDLNPVRAGIVDFPEDYCWSSLGHHVQSGNKDGFLSTDFGLPEFNLLNEKERVRRYRRHLYEAGGVKRPGKDFAGKERETESDSARTRRFTGKTRYFSDSGIIGSKKFVALNYQLFKSHFQCKREKKPKPIKGLDGIYSLKKLSKSL